MKFRTVLSAAAGIFLLGAAGCCTGTSCPQRQISSSPLKEDVKLLLPEKIYAVPGVETNIYFENVVRVINPDNYIFFAKAPYGRCDEKRWRYTPGPGDPRSFKVRVSVTGSSGLLAEKDVTVEVASATAGKGKKITMLIVGDSLTDATVYPRRILELFKKNGNPSAAQIGRHAGYGRPVVRGGAAHEGYGGWTWERFLTRWTDDAAFAKLKKRRDTIYARSPFLKQVNGKPVLDMKDYFKRTNGGKAPDFITFQLGVNDIFSATDATIEKRIETIFGHMDKLLAEARKAAPDAVIGVGLPTPGCFTQDGFGRNYKSRHARWQYKKNQHRLVEAMMQKFAKSNPYKVELVPVYLNLDCENNFPAVRENVNGGNVKRMIRQSNGVHPSPEGYRQIGDTYYCWMKAVLSRPEQKQ